MNRRTEMHILDAARRLGAFEGDPHCESVRRASDFLIETFAQVQDLTVVDTGDLQSWLAEEVRDYPDYSTTYKDAGLASILEYRDELESRGVALPELMHS